MFHVECRGFKSHLRQLIFLGKSDCLRCAVLLCLVVCLTLYLFLSSFCYLSLKHVCFGIVTATIMYTCTFIVVCFVQKSLLWSTGKCWQSRDERPWQTLYRRMKRLNIVCVVVQSSCLAVLCTITCTYSTETQGTCTCTYVAQW